MGCVILGGAILVASVFASVIGERTQSDLCRDENALGVLVVLAGLGGAAIVLFGCTDSPEAWTSRRRRLGSVTAIPG
jgi:hypothetical protein